MIKHFKIFPIGIDQNNLFDEQKIFLIYLMGKIPSFDDWTVQTEYKTKLFEIKKQTTIALSQSDLDISKIQGRNIEELKKERLKEEKERKIKELNKLFGIKEEKAIPPRPEGMSEIDINKKQAQQKKVWDMLQGKGLIKNGE